MNGKRPMKVPTLVKRAVIPLIVITVVLLLPSLRNWVAAQFQSHPLQAASFLGLMCFIVAFLAAGKLPLSRTWSATVKDASVIVAICLILLGGGLFFTGASTVLAVESVRAGALRCAMLWALAWFMGGFLTGFLFGVPRLADSARSDSKIPIRPTPGGFAQQPNTNLEQISDWLTKIIVGLGLVELRSVPSHLRAAATWVAETLSATTVPNQAMISFAGSVIVYFSIIGFLAGYLLTLLFLAGAFGRAGQQAYGGGASFAEDALSKRILDFWKPKGGPADPQNEQKLAQWVKANFPEGTIRELISAKELDSARQKAVADLQIP